MKKYFLISIFFFFAFAANAQFAFQKTYGDTSSNTGYYLLQGTDSGFYLMCRYLDIYTHQSYMQIIKTDKYGDSVGIVIPQLPFGYGKVCTNSANNFLVLSVFDSLVGANQFIDTIYVAKVDTGGIVLSLWKYADTLELGALDIIETSDGGCLIGVSSWNYPYTSQILLIKVDISGNIDWQKFVLPYSSGADELVQDLIETDDHHYIIEVSQSSGSMWMGAKYMLKVDTMGNLLWTTQLTYGYPGNNEHQIISTDTGYIYLDNIGYSMSSPFESRISMVDTGGTLRWSKILTHNSFYREIIQGPQNEFYLFERDLVITKLDQQLDSVSSAFYGFPSSVERINYFTQLSDGRLACLGYSQTGFSSQSDDVYFLVCDSLFVTGLPEISGSNSEILIFPNPTWGKSRMSGADIGQITSVEIYNSTGKKVINWCCSSKTGKDEIQLDLSNLPSGIYFIQATSNEKVWRGKVVKD